MLLIFASISAGGYFTWDNRTRVFETLGVIEPPPAKPSEGGEPTEFDPGTLTIEMIQDLAIGEDPWKALSRAQAWRRGLRQHGVSAADPRYAVLGETSRQILDSRNSDMLDMIAALANAEDPREALKQAETFAGILRACRLPDDDNRLAELQRVAGLLIEKVYPINLEVIAALLETADARESLIQAQLWQEELRDRDVPRDDARRKKLEEVVQELKRRLVPSPQPPPACIAEFRQAVQELSQQLKAGDLDAARQTRDRAQSLLDKHTDDLADRARRFLGLKARLRKLLLLKEGVNDVRRLFDDQVEPALRLKAQIRFRVSITPLVEPEESEELIQRMRGLEIPLKFARGKRAVGDAERCDRSNDRFARDREVRRAYELLPVCGESKTRPLFKRIEDWYKELENTSGAVAGRGRPTSEFGREIALRDVFERTLDHFGKKDAREELLAACLEAYAAFSRAGLESSARCTHLGNMLAEVLDADLAEILLAEQDLPEMEIAQRLRSIRRTLDRAAPWKGLPRFRALAGALRQYASERGEQAIREATALAENDQLEDALDTIAPTVDLAGPPVSQRASWLQQRWIAEQKRREDKQAEEAAWKEIQSLVARDAGEKELEAWRQLVQFVRRYPASTHIDDARAHANRIRAEVEKKFDRQVELLTEAAEQGRWPEVFRWMTVLESAAVTPGQPDRLKHLSELAARQKERAEREYLLLGIQKRMFTESHVIEVRRVVIQYLLIHEDDVVAQELLEKAKQEGAARARKLITEAMRFKNIRPEICREKLHRAYNLDPGGEQGAKALEMLRQD